MPQKDWSRASAGFFFIYLQRVQHRCIYMIEINACDAHILWNVVSKPEEFRATKMLYNLFSSGISLMCVKLWTCIAIRFTNGFINFAWHKIGKKKISAWKHLLQRNMLPFNQNKINLKSVFRIFPQTQSHFQGFCDWKPICLPMIYVLSSVSVMR